MSTLEQKWIFPGEKSKFVINGLYIDPEKGILLQRVWEDWILPGGKQEKWESQKGCLERELREEILNTKIIEIWELFGTFTGKTPKSHRAIEVTVYKIILLLDWEPKASQEIDETRFILPDKILTFNLSSITREIILQYLSQNN